jgi:uncharacterized membrane protein
MQDRSRETAKVGLAYTFVVALVVFLIIDGVWLTTLGRGFYVAEIGSLLKSPPNLPVAGLFYTIYVAGLLYFVIQPALAADSLQKAIVAGAFFGLVCYATYDLTNLSTLNGFTWRIAIIDLVWGTVLSASVSAITVLIVRFLQIKI